LLTAEPIDAAEALLWGLVDKVAPADRLDQAVDELARPILAAGPRAVRSQKRLILDWEELPMTAAIERGIDSFVAAFDSDEPGRMADAVLARMKARRQE
ncbi:MAG TPA: enoyl-CoA hydratase-related protein, partial [Stellaceae bacterium]|nr:enoyl-CoA hydratase-related protein [Stellaceae bacterium]